MPLSHDRLHDPVRAHFALDGAWTALPGERDLNFRLDAPTGGSYVVKVADPARPIGALRLQVELVDVLAKAELSIETPRQVLGPEGTALLTAPVDGSPRTIQVLTWVPGHTLRHVRDRPTALLRQWGSVAGQLSRALRTFDHPAAHRYSAWDPHHAQDHRELLPLIDADRQALALHFFDWVDSVDFDEIAELRRSVCYADAHEDNLLVSQQPDLSWRITGLVDVGDAVFTYTVCELAIACAYAAMDLPDPVGAMAAVVRGYVAEFTLSEPELLALYPLIVGRLLTTVTQAARARVADPDNAYRAVSEQQAWRLLERLRDICPRFAHYAFRAAAGVEAYPLAEKFERWLGGLPELAPVLAWRGRRVRPFDFSVGSRDLGNYGNYVELPRFEAYVRRALEDQGADIGYGGYLETRPFYTSDLFQAEGNEGPRWRTLHLGLDLWSPAGEPVYAPLPGRVHSFRQNDGPRDYGATIVIEHRVTVPVLEPGQSSRLQFWTLYGHLSTASLKGLTVGQEVSIGQAFAKTGKPRENGGWPPHLHFQVSLDLLDQRGDFPGVAYPEEREIWASLCPDAGLLAGVGLSPRRRRMSSGRPATHSPLSPPKSPAANVEVDAEPEPFEHLDLAEAPAPHNLVEQRSRLLGRSLSLSYREPLHIVRGVGAYLLDDTGRRYLDTVNNVAHVGHEHPRVVAAIQRQAAVLNTNTRYLHPEITAFAAELCATLPAELSVVHFVNSGSEANELALRMARAAAGREDIIAVEHGYHGNTAATIAVSSYKFDGRGGSGRPPSTHLVPAPDTYRGEHRDPEAAGPAYAAYLDTTIAELQSRDRGPAAFICESILSCGGQVVLPKGYLPAAYAKTRAAGGVCIADEVQVGLGRVGSHFWGFELQGVVPDIVVIGKPIGNGHPLGAVVCTPAVAEGFANGMEYFNTFGGNPVSCAAGRAVLRVVREAKLQAHALQTGELLQGELRGLQQRDERIGDVRGHGLFLGVELVTDAQTRAPDVTLATHITDRLRERGILMSTDGPLHNVLKIKPPMCFGEREVDFLMRELGRVLDGARSTTSR